MSGEAVLISALLTPAGLAAAGTLAAGSLALELVNGWQEERRRIAEAKMREEQARVEAWRQFQRNQRDRMESLDRARSEMQEQLAALRLGAASIDAPAPQQDARPRGFLEGNARPPEALSGLSALQRLFSALPGELLEARDAPMVRLRDQVERLRQQFDSPQPPPVQTLDDLKILVERTLDSQLEELERGRQAQALLMSRCERLLDEVVTYSELGGDTSSGAEMKALREHLLGLLHLENAQFTDIRVLESKFAQLREGIDREVEQTALREGIGIRMRHHLEDMGYRRLSEEDRGYSNWQLPGGEQVRIALQRNLGVGFQLRHERADDSDAELSESELAFFRRQEQQWCDDLTELTRRLTADGFQYRLEFERDVPESSVPIVVVEDVEELLEEEDAHWDEDRKRRRLT